MRCHYEVLGIALDASNDDIKKAYRKCALQWHPDKHGENKEEANKRFLEIQDAYETLSDAQERAWYDSHREVLINGGTPGGEEGDANYLFNIYPYFTSSCFRGFGDDENGFFAIYRDMFANLAEEDRPFYDEKIDIPEFGDSSSSYDDVVGSFYSFWLSYCTPRSFVWVEKHNVRDANDRAVRRLMEKENKKLRDKAKKERNEEIRKLVEFVRKKDKRVDEYKKTLQARTLLAQQKAKDKKEADRVRRAEQMKSYVEPEWSAVESKLREMELDEERRTNARTKASSNKAVVVGEDESESDGDAKANEDDEVGSEDGDEKIVDGEGEEENNENDNDDDGDDDDDDADESLLCVACDKAFKSAKSFLNHERSKKHKQNVELLKRHMKEEDASFFFSNNTTVDSQKDQDQSNEKGDEAPSATKSKLSKKQKKRRKQAAAKNDADDSDDEEPVSAKQAEEEEEEKKEEEKESIPNEGGDASATQAATTTATTTTKTTPSAEVETEEASKSKSESDEKAAAASKASICSICRQEFATRNKLFDHIKKEGHVALKTVVPTVATDDAPLSHNAMKKNKRLLKSAAAAAKR